MFNLFTLSVLQKNDDAHSLTAFSATGQNQAAKTGQTVAARDKKVAQGGVQ